MEITFGKYLWKNGAVPLGIITVVSLIFTIPQLIAGDTSMWLWHGVLAFLWALVTGLDYFMWKNNSSDLFSSIGKKFKKLFQ